ncbi:MAG TPA: helix-turn-helix domain-containing protein [Fimbriiglobus sp.]|jgi:HTH-type transcriptional regulator/antitoxin HigA|nr:helix-turn-helix domain-containing protein [Fimbriiglobus sp.]
MTRKRDGSSLGSVYGKVQDRYLELIHTFPLRPIRSDDELDAAIGVINSLIDKNKLSAPEDDYLDVLSDLVEAYEKTVIPIAPVPDSRMLRYFIDLRETTQAEVAKGVGIAESTISEVLSGKRKLNRKQIGRLARYFHVDPGVFAFPG